MQASVVCWGVLHLRWLTMQAGKSIAEWLATSLKYRDFKTNCYRVGLMFLLVGLQIRDVVSAVHMPAGQLVMGSAAVLVALIGLRILWALTLPSAWQGVRASPGRRPAQGAATRR